MGAQSSNVSKFFVRRKASRVNTMLNSSAEYVIPQRIEGRVAPTKSGSAVRPESRSLMVKALDAEHSAHPGDDLRCPKADRNSQNRAKTPPPRHSVCHCHAA